MKKAFLYSIFVAALAVVSCQKEGLDPLTGVFPEAKESTLTTLVSNETVKTETTREFSFHFTGDGGATLETVLVMARANYALKAGSYVPGTTNGSFIASRTKVNGVAVTDQSGVIVVRNTEGSSTYTFEFALFDQAGNAYRSFWKGDIIYNPDPEPVGLNTLYVAQANTNNTVTVKVGTPGLSMDMVGTPSGDGYLFTADLYSPDGYLHEGTYTAATTDVTGEGQFTPGYAYDLSEYGMGIAHWGTCWWVNGEARDLSYGSITVAKKGNKWIITWGEEATYPDWAVFEGEIEALTPSGGGDYDGVSLTQNFGIIDYSMYGMKMVGIELGTSGIVATPGGWGNTYTGNGNYLKLEIYSEDGKIAPGTYKACTVGGEIGPGEFGIGYDGMYGASGTTWYTLVNDEATYKYITDGTVTVEVDGDDYKITIESSVVNARYGFGEGGGGEDFDGTVLTQFWGLSDYTGYGVNLAGIYLASDGLASDGASLSGTGNYLKLEYYSTSDLKGLPAPGTYKACEVGGVVGEGEFGIGYDGQWGESGTEWYTVTDGAQAGTYVTDGTLTVSVEGDVYTIILESTVVKAKYVGKLSAQ
jgi:hypothetical protein